MSDGRIERNEQGRLVVTTPGGQTITQEDRELIGEFNERAIGVVQAEHVRTTDERLDALEVKVDRLIAAVDKWLEPMQP